MVVRDQQISSGVIRELKLDVVTHCSRYKSNIERIMKDKREAGIIEWLS